MMAKPDAIPHIAQTALRPADEVMRLKRLGSFFPTRLSFMRSLIRQMADERPLSRANKSVRFFEHTADALSKGAQPDAQMVQDIGYLMRTTAVYGNGKFGIADRARIQNRPVMSGPFQAEMLTVWLIRNFSHDLVEHVAKARSQTAVPLSKNIKRHLGIGNSTGLGMAPFLVNHPVLLNNWMMVREQALARVRANPHIDKTRATTLIARASQHLEEWNVPDPVQLDRIKQLRIEWKKLHTNASWMDQPAPWDALFEAFKPVVDTAMSVPELRNLIECHGEWALTPDFNKPHETAQFWYVSEEKLEPRLGDRHNEPGADRESPLDIARQIQHLHRDLIDNDQTTLAEFLMGHPQHRIAARRVQSLEQFPYAEIRDNLISDACLPIDMLRCKLSFFGASKFDPKSDRWTRITLYQGAPLPDELKGDADDWWLPCFAP